MNRKWDYNVFVTEVGKEGFVVRPELDVQSFEKTLNRLGGEGWELVSVFDVNMLQGGSKQVIATFKRPRPDEAPAAPPPLPE